jgi:acyl carrier protein
VTQTEEIIKDHIHQEFLRDRPQTDLASDESLIQGGIVDSLGIFLLIGFLEERFGIKVEPQDVVIENFETVGAIANLVELRSGAAPRKRDS